MTECLDLQLTMLMIGLLTIVKLFKSSIVNVDLQLPMFIQQSRINSYCPTDFVIPCWPTFQKELYLLYLVSVVKFEN